MIRTKLYKKSVMISIIHHYYNSVSGTKPLRDITVVLERKVSYYLVEWSLKLIVSSGMI